MYADFTYAQDINQLFTKDFISCGNRTPQQDMQLSELWDNVQSPQKMKQYKNISAYKTYQNAHSEQDDIVHIKQHDFAVDSK